MTLISFYARNWKQMRGVEGKKSLGEGVGRELGGDSEARNWRRWLGARRCWALDSYMTVVGISSCKLAKVK